MGIRLARYCKQDILYWPVIGTNTAGKPIYPVNPTALKVRWDDEMIEVIGTDGRTVTSRAGLMCASEIKYQSIVFKGTLATWRALPTYPARPTQVQGGYEVVLTAHTPKRNGQNFLYRAWL